MSSVVRPAGPLPPRVYWFRRLMLLIVVVALLFWLSRFVGANDEPAAASSPRTTEPVATGGVTHPGRKPSGYRLRKPSRPAAEQPVGKHEKHRKREKPGNRPRQRPPTVKTPPASPDGPCRPAEVLVRPVVSAHNEAGSAVEIRLQLETTGRSACTLSIGPDNLLVKVASGSDEIWTSAQCPQAVFPSLLVVRSAEPLTYRVVWSGSRSAPRCPPSTAPADPGTYVVTAAVIGGEPARTRFVLQPERTGERGKGAGRGQQQSLKSKGN